MYTSALAESSDKGPTTKGISPRPLVHWSEKQQHGQTYNFVKQAVLQG